MGSTILSNDLRLLVLLGAIALLVCGLFVGASIGRSWFGGTLLCLPLCAVFTFFVLQQLPFLWPTLLIWLAAAFIGLFFFSDRRLWGLTISATIAVLIFSTWYCVAYIPDQMQRAMTHIGKDSAPAFQLDPVSEGNVPRTATPGKILVIDFSQPGADHAKRSCRNSRRSGMSFRIGRISNSSSSQPMLVGIHQIDFGNSPSDNQLDCPWHSIPMERRMPPLLLVVFHP
jgi:hypothetical protein